MFMFHSRGLCSLLVIDTLTFTSASAFPVDRCVPSTADLAHKGFICYLLGPFKPKWVH